LKLIGRRKIARKQHDPLNLNCCILGRKLPRGMGFLM